MPVSLRGASGRMISVSPGDFILADEHGAIVIPSSVVVEVLERSEALTVTEQQVCRALKEGVSLWDALAKFGHV